MPSSRTSKMRDMLATACLRKNRKCKKQSVLKKQLSNGSAYGVARLSNGSAYGVARLSNSSAYGVAGLSNGSAYGLAGLSNGSASGAS